MSQENVEIVRRVFEGGADFARGDAEAGLDAGAVLAGDFEWIPAAELPASQSYRGLEGFADFMRTWTEDFEDWSIRLERLIDAGDDRVVAFVHQRGTGRASGAPVELHFGQIYELKDRRVVRIRNYLDPAAALEAAELSE